MTPTQLDILKRAVAVHQWGEGRRWSSTQAALALEEQGFLQGRMQTFSVCACVDGRAFLVTSRRVWEPTDEGASLVASLEHA